MSLSAGEIAAVVEELQPLAGARLSDVRVHAPRALSLELRGPAGSAEVLLSAAFDRPATATSAPVSGGNCRAWCALVRKRTCGKADIGRGRSDAGKGR